MEHQKKETSGIKTHEEIMALFKALEPLEEKVKNPELLINEIFESETLLQEIELPSEIPIDAVKEPPSVEPIGELPREKKDKSKRFSLFRHNHIDQPAEKKIKRLSFWRKVKIGQVEPETTTETQQSLQELKPLRSTFVLQFDDSGNLVGLPRIKPKKEMKGLSFFKRKGEEGQPQEEPVKGIKGKLKRVLSKLKPRKSKEGEASSGIGGKLKGILKRKGK